MKNIFGWMGLKIEEDIISTSQKHIEATICAVNNFAEAVNSFINHDINKKAVAIEKVRECEQEADLLKEKIIDKITESVLVPPDREDLMRFIKTLDKIADWTLGSARLLSFLEGNMPDIVLENMAAASQIIVSSVNKLRAAMNAFMSNKIKEALALVAEIERYEHEADEKKRDLIEAILNANLNPNNLILMFHLADYMEGVTDQIESSADFIKIIAIKKR